MANSNIFINGIMFSIGMKRGLLLIMLFLLPFSYAATLHGTVYDLDLNPANNALVKVSSVPEQVMVAKDGRYSFELSKGNYKLTVEYSSHPYVRSRPQ